MRVPVYIVDENPHEDGVLLGKALGPGRLRAETSALLNDELLQPTLGQTSDRELQTLLHGRLESAPDTTKYPELAELFPELVERLRGKAKGAGVSLAEVALHEYLGYRRNQIFWWRQFQAPPPEEIGLTDGCSGVVVVGDEIWLGKNVDSLPSYPPPRNLDKVIVKKPRTGYACLPVRSEAGIANSGGASVSTWLDDEPADVWPFIDPFPITRYAATVKEVSELYTRYADYLPNRQSVCFVDKNGDSISVDNSFRRNGVSPGRDGLAWHTEGYFRNPEMKAFLAAKRDEFSRRFDISPASYHNAYYADCVVRFTNLGRLLELPGDRGYAHIRRALEDHSPFPRALCRHDSPDRPSYDKTITNVSRAVDYKNRTMYERYATPDRPCCEQTDVVTEYILVD